MCSKLGKDGMADSQAAIKKYLNFREQNGYRHKAHILISTNGKNYFNGILYISVIVDSYNMSVVIEGNNEYERNFYSDYSSKHCKFTFISGTLIIQATDRWNNAINIDITGI